MQKTVLHNQSVFDITLQHTGSLQKIFEVALLNGISITQDLLPGQVLELPTVDDEDLFNFFETKNIVPATAIYVNAIATQGDGIGSMIIETSFIVAP